MAKQEKIQATTHRAVKVGDVMRSPLVRDLRYIRVVKVSGPHTVRAASISGAAYLVTGVVIPDEEAMTWFAAQPKSEARLQAEAMAKMYEQHDAAAAKQ